ncbi:MAG: glutamine--fructose-6-phosphate transaminase (isomerizing) [Minisyncoccota bacterium]
MWGIFGYTGVKRDAADAVLEGLQRLDYRGYDSWGIGVVHDGLHVGKKVGIVGKTQSLPKSSVGIGHTRWATHGAVTEINAHPHFSSDKSFILAHNGIAENADVLKSALIKEGYSFITETDTESIVRLVEKKLSKRLPLKDAVRAAFKELTGRNTIIVLAKNGDIVAARNGSPLVVGFGARDAEVYFSSDIFSFAPHVKETLVLDNGQMAVYQAGAFAVYDIASGKAVRAKREKNLLKDVAVDKGSYPHFMLKEIHEAPFVLRQVTHESENKYRELARAIKKARAVYCIGSGTAGAAAAQIAYYLRVYGGIPAISLIGAEASDYRDLIGPKDLLIAPSQSGETADVLEVLEIAKKRGAKIASFVNMPGSMMTRLSDYAFMAHAGPEICVMSTKIFVSQVAWGYLLAKAVQGSLPAGKRNLKRTALTIEKMLRDKKYMSLIEDHAKRLSKSKDIFLLGKGQNLQIIKEGMVKMIEGAYVHAHAIAAGDLKHYAITLMEPGVSVIATISNDAVKNDTLNAVHEVHARGASVFGIAPEPEKSFSHYLPVPDSGETTAIVNVIPLQLLAYFMAVTLKHNVDKPRNIAKSVTVR